MVETQEVEGGTDPRTFSRLVKNGVSGRDPALRGSGGCSHTGQYAALPHRRAPGLTARYLFFQHPVRGSPGAAQGR